MGDVHVFSVINTRIRLTFSVKFTLSYRLDATLNDYGY